MRRRVLLPLLLVATSDGLLAEEPPISLTTESTAYCESLAARLAALPGSRVEPALSLGEEGRALCATGRVRTGIAKLRRALRAAQGEGQ